MPLLISCCLRWLPLLLLLAPRLTIMTPVLYALTLGTVGTDNMHRQTSLNELYSHIGTVLYAMLAGACSLYGYINWVYYGVALMAAICCALVMSINPAAINDHGARGLDIDDVGHHLPPKMYSEIFEDFRLFVFLSTILLFHFANAAMLPLLSQLQSKDNFEAGIMITAGNIIISQVTQGVIAILVGERVRQWGTKYLFMIAFLILPIRGCAIVSVLYYTQSPLYLYLLSFTQVFVVFLICTLFA